MPSNVYDLIVIGSGSAAQSAAFRIRNEGWSVAMVDSRPFGGTCALRGCDPKKVLVGAAEIADRAKNMQKSGLTGPTELNWPDLMSFKKTFTEQVPESRIESLKDAGIEPIRGRATFIDERTIQVNGRKLEANKILLANGAKPAPLNIDGEEHLTYSDEFLGLPELPKNIVLIGGGYISFEFAHIAARAGSSVTILHRGERALERFDNDLVRLLVDRTKEIGVDVRINTEVTRVQKTGERYTVTATHNRETTTFDADLVVHGAGRIPDIDDMQLEKGNIEFNKKGIKVNEYLQSVSNERVYSAGDAAASPGLPLTPIGGLESRIAAANILNGNSEKPDYTATPSVVFTVPPIAKVGLREEEAKADNIPHTVNFQETATWYSSKRINETHSAFKVIIHKKNDTILGAHLLGNAYEEVVNLFAMAIRFGITTSELKRMVYAYPTRCSDITSML
jgi:glutathione reductase (NADPH)